MDDIVIIRHKVIGINTRMAQLLINYGRLWGVCAAKETQDNAVTALKYTAIQVRDEAIELIKGLHKDEEN